MKASIWIAAVVLLILSAWQVKDRADNHEFYVSITELEIKDDTLQISMRLFSDDLEFALNKGRSEHIFLDDPAKRSKNFVHIRDYVDARFSVSNAAKSTRVEWLGHEFEEDVCWVYGQLPLSPDLTMLFIRNEVLMSVYPRQQNIIHFNKGETIETELATTKYPEVRFRLE